MSVNDLFLRAASARGLGGLGECVLAPRRGGLGYTIADASGSNCPSGTAPGVRGPSGNRYCVPIQGPEYRPDSMETEPKYTVSFKDQSGREVKSSFDIWKPGSIAAEASGGGGGFWSSILDTAGKVFATAATPQQGYNLAVPKESSPWPWVLGGVAVAGLVVFALTRSKK